MDLVIFVWFMLSIIFLGVPGVYYLYLRRVTSKSWKLKVDETYFPSITILVPTYNEAKVIDLKLENLCNLEYPKDLTQVIVVDSASTDNTMQKLQEFVKSHPEMNIQIVNEEYRNGKSPALNLALQSSTGEVVIVSDVDCFWRPDILYKSLPYLADPTVGAIAGQERILNPDQSWVTQTEYIYRENMFKVQLGESRLYSTIQFEGGFSAYKRSILNRFDCETGSDDSGTALNIVQKGARTIVIPDAVFFTFFPSSWRGKMVIKARRARQMVQIWAKCFKLLLKRELLLPKRIALFEIFLFLFNPFVFLLLIIGTFVLLSQYPTFFLLLVLLFLVPKTRLYVIEIIQNNFVILSALTAIAMNKKSVIWRIAKESRTVVDPDILRKESLL